VVTGRVVSYKGDANAKDIYKFLTGLPSINIQNIRSLQQADSFVRDSCTKGSKVCFLLLTQNNAGTDPLVLKSLAYHYRDPLSSKYLAVAAIYLKSTSGGGTVAPDTALSLAEEFGVKSFPTALLICGGDDKKIYEKYSGNIKDFDALTKFVSAYASNPKKCVELEKSVKVKRGKIDEIIKNSKKFTQSSLVKKKIGELREIIDALSITSKTPLLEKTDFVNVILEHVGVRTEL
jgi:hypothetical protein